MHSPFVIYAEFKLNPKEVQWSNRDHVDICYRDKYQEHIAFTYDYKVVYIDDRFGIPVQTYRSENSVC